MSVNVRAARASEAPSEPGARLDVGDAAVEVLAQHRGRAGGVAGEGAVAEMAVLAAATSPRKQAATIR